MPLLYENYGTLDSFSGYRAKELVPKIKSIIDWLNIQPEITQINDSIKLSFYLGNDTCLWAYFSTEGIDCFYAVDEVVVKNIKMKSGQEFINFFYEVSRK